MKFIGSLQDCLRRFRLLVRAQESSFAARSTGDWDIWISLRIAIAATLGTILPLSFTQQLKSFSLHQTPSQIACLYFTAGSFYLLGAVIASASAAALGRFSPGKRVRLNLAAASIWIAYLLVSIGYLLAAWLRSLAPANQISQEIVSWVIGGILAITLSAFAIRRCRHYIGQPSQLVAKIVNPLAHLGLTIYVISALVAVDHIARYAVRVEMSQAPDPACSSKAVRRPNIFLISVDTVAARDMSIYGYELNTTPHLEQLARASYVFDRFYAPSNFTTPGIASLLTGVRPWTHRVFQMYGMERPAVLRNSLPRALRSCGYVTAALVSNGLAHPKSHGLATEFDYLPRNYLSYAREIVRDSLAYSPSFSGQSLIDLYPFGQLVNAADRLASRMRPDWRPYSPDAQIDDALAWASKRTQDPNPIFVWTHLFPPHHFYLPPDPYLKSIDNSDDFSTYASQDFDYGYYKDDHQPDVNKLRSRYDENLRWADASLGRYIRGLDALGLLDGALVIVTSDHGESFSHGYWGHIGPMLHEDLIHIPLVIKLPRQHAGKRISDVSELIDLFPTILDVVGLAPPTDIEGQSLLPSIRGQDGQRATAVSMQLDASSALGRATAGTIALVTPRFKLIRHVKAGAGRDELYDLVADPDEARNIARDKKDKLEEMRSTLRRLSGSRLNDPADDLTDSSGQQRGLSM